MPKVMKWSTSADEIDEVETKDQQEFEPYDGPLPPNGMILRFDVKRITADTFQSGNSGLVVLLEVNDPAKSKYNGLAVWDRITDSEAAAWKIRQFLDGIGGVGSDWAKTAIEEIDGKTHVVKFGKIRVEGLAVRVQTKRGSYQGEPKTEVGRYMVRDAEKLDLKSAKAKASSRANNDDNDDDDDGEPPF